MSAEMPLPTISSEKSSSSTKNRPTSLFTKDSANNCKLGKPNVLLTSTTPSPGYVTTRIPISKSVSLTPSPGMLRRSTSLRLRGDRSQTTNSGLFHLIGNGHQQNFNNTLFHLKHDPNCCFRSNNININSESRGSVNAGPYSTRASNTTDRSPAHHSGSGGSSNRIGAPGTPGTIRKHLQLAAGSAKSPQSIQESPTRQRSLSLSLSTQTASPHTPPVSPDRGFDPDDEDDLDSLHSYSSIASTASCDHAYVARNGTTFSGRKMKYVVHCSSHAGQTGDEYLTPTQRAQRQIRRLKALLQQAKLDLEQKDSDIFRLTKEVVELRLYKASLNSPEEKSNSTSSDAPVTVCENTPESPQPPAPIPLSDMQSSCADSGHFEDLTGASPCHRDKAVSTDQLDSIENRDEERKKLIEYYENKLQELTRMHGDETQELKRQHNDRVEALLKTLSDVNERYCQLMPDYETAKERIRDLEKQLDDVFNQLKDSEEKQRKMYLKVYAENKDAIDGAIVPSEASTSGMGIGALNRVSVAELLHQLQITQIELDNIKAMYRRLVEARGNKNDLDPEVTLQFLKSAIYYFLTDKENHRGHLRAIESILGFSHDEIANINKATNS